MKRILSQDNPFGYTPKGLAFELMRDLSKPCYHLDYGTYNGAFVGALKRANLVDAALGIDVNAEVVTAHRKDMPAAVKLRVIKKNAPLEFAPGTFDSISILGVVEHVHDQVRLLSQLEKALKADGTILIAVPGQHLLSGLDMGNFKFRFPRIHRWVYTARHSREEYHQRYVECRNGLFGDIEVEKMWHEHFSLESMNALLHKVGLRVTDVDGQGFFQRFLVNAAYFVGGRKGLMGRLIDTDARRFASSELVFLVKKMKPSASAVAL